MFIFIIAVAVLAFVVYALVAGPKHRLTGEQPIAAGTSSSVPLAAEPDRLSLGFGDSLSADGVFFEWKGPMGRGGFKVPRQLVQGVTVEKVSFGKVTLKVFGAGSELASVPNLLPSQAEQAQTWMMERIGK
ncbi:MAG TPA: hypothetical protein VGK74_02615 [Symbiobacteriaceae bacterium]